MSSLVAKISNGTTRVNGFYNNYQHNGYNPNEFDLLKKDYDDGNPVSNGTVDVAFKMVKPNATGFYVWKIENNKVISIPKDQYGTFYENNAYIIYAVSEYGQKCGIDTVSRDVNKSNIECHIHFWLGVSTNTEKSGSAAYKTVELDSYTGGISTQHREYQEHESPRFKSYFKEGIRILKDQQENIKEDEIEILYKIKNETMVQLEKVTWNLMNSETVYALNGRNHFFLWIGRSSNAADKTHSVKVLQQLRAENKISNVVFVDDGYEQTLEEEAKVDFNKCLPLNKRSVQPHEPIIEGVKDHHQREKDKAHGKHYLRTYKCADNNGRYRVTEFKSGTLNQTDLDSNDVYIIDHGRHGIWVWVGKKTKEREKAEALRNARGFVKKKNYPNYTSVTRVIDGNEPTEFKLLFPNWKDKNSDNSEKLIGTKIDVELLLERTSLAAESQLVDDGSGTIKNWRVKKNDLVQISKENQGIFFSDGTYIIVYAYNNMKRNSKDLIIYTWMGNEANQEDIEGAFLNKDEINRELGGTAVLVTITENNEPPHFLQIFQGKMLVLKTPTASSTNDGRAISPLCNTYLLKIVGSTTYTSKAVQMPMVANSLDSNHCYVLKQINDVYVWCGIYSTGDQREMAKNFAGKSFEILLERKENDNFWDILGGQSNYKNVKNPTEINTCRPSRLFSCYWDHFPFKVAEIFNFSQSDLLSENVMLLDAFSTIFIWFGKLSCRRKDTFYMKHVLEYLKREIHRNVNVPIIQIPEAYEPIIFTGFFKNWDDTYWDKYKSFEKLREEIESDEINLTKMKITPRQPTDKQFDQYPKYPVETLKTETDKIPTDVDMSRKELHLTHDDFVRIFKTNYDYFSSLPKWKQQELKKGVGLF